MATVAPAPPTHDLRGPALDKAFLKWDDSSKDAGASSVFGRQGVWVGKPAWYVLWLLGLWWFFDATYCLVNQPDVGMFGQWGLCHSPLMILASLLSGLATIASSTALMVKYRGYAKPLLFIVIFAGCLNFIHSLLILASHTCSTDPSFQNSTTKEWYTEAAGRPCGLQMALIPMAYGLCQIGALFFLVAPQHSFLQVTGGLFLYNVGMVVGNIAKGATIDFGLFGGCCGFIVVGGFLKWKFEEAKKKAQALTHQDYNKYRCVWEETLKAHANDLKVLENVWAEKISVLPKSKKRQPGRKGTEGKPIVFIGRKWVIKQDPTLSELYAMADQVNPELQTKCQQWSEVLPCCASDHKGNMAKFHRGSVKKSERALVKVYRSYDEDIGRLCDLCRCSLVFDSVADLAKGLEMICDDQEIEVQSCNPLKQRFAIAYDDKISAGYRDVQLCVKMKTNTVVQMGKAAEHHLCEVQLHLKAFYEKKGDGGHDNYKIARNLRGA